MKRRDCPICKSHRKQVVYQDRNRRDGYQVTSAYVRCLDCGMVYLDPIPDFGKFEGWDQVYAGASSARGSRLLNVVSRLSWHWNALFDRTERLHCLPIEVQHPGNRRPRLLDIGCNSGARLVSFVRRGWEVWGIDMSRQALREAEARIREGRFLRADFLETALPEGYFDVIRADAVWEHVEDPIRFLQKCYGLLRAGGLLLLYVPNFRSFLQTCFGRYNINSWIPFHVNFFTKVTAKRALYQAGFLNVRVWTNTQPSYYALTLRQFVSRNKESFNSRDLGWLVLVFLIASPLHLLIDAVGLGEELVVTAQKNDGSDLG